MSLVPLGALAALGGAYPSSTVPLLIAAALTFVLAGSRVATGENRALDLALIACLVIIAVQLVPLPPEVLAALSPRSWSLHGVLNLEPSETARPLTIDPTLTRRALATVLSALLLFWAARTTFTRGGGVRVAVRAITWGGAAAAFVGLIQRATAPTLLLWTWKPLDPGAQPFGPFVNRNHFATWLLLAASVAGGYLVAHMRSHPFTRAASGRLVLRDLLADGSGLLLAASITIMLLALVASLSRAALLGVLAALAFGAFAARKRFRGDTAVKAGALLLVALVGVAVWVNREGLARRLDATIASAEVGRPIIWRETIPVVRNFWLTGTGAGTYGQAMLQYQRTRTTTLFNQAHNEYLQLAAEGGLILTLAAVAAAVCWLRLARRRIGQETHELVWIRIGAASGMAGLAVQGLFETGLRMPANTLLFALLAAIVIHAPRTIDDS